MDKFLQFKYGFTYEGVNYGWYEKQLYRLPFTRNLKSYGLKLIKPCLVDSTVCYNVQRKKLTINRMKGITREVDWSVRVFENNDVPF